jgi:hypothetical protein
MELVSCLMVLLFSLCDIAENLVESLKPAYLSLILGLVLTEEISLSGLNASMMVRAEPSISAHYLHSPFGPDILRKVLVFCLAVAGATTGKLQAALTLGGIGAACMSLTANLGARAWHFLHWKPMRYRGPGADLVAYGLAIATGVFLPYVGHRTISSGGKGALESVIRSALLVAVLFLISDYDEIQSFLVVGSEVGGIVVVLECALIIWSTRQTSKCGCTHNLPFVS